MGPAHCVTLAAANAERKVQITAGNADPHHFTAHRPAGATINVINLGSWNLLSAHGTSPGQRNVERPRQLESPTRRKTLSQWISWSCPVVILPQRRLATRVAQ